MLLYTIAAEVFANLINADKRIKGIQIGGHKIKIVNFIDSTTIFLRDITCVNKMQGILKLYEKDQLDNFFKNPSLDRMVHIRIEFINQDNCNRHNFH